MKKLIFENMFLNIGLYFRLCQADFGSAYYFTEIILATTNIEVLFYKFAILEITVSLKSFNLNFLS